MEGRINLSVTRGPFYWLELLSTKDGRKMWRVYDGGTAYRDQASAIAAAKRAVDGGELLPLRVVRGTRKFETVLWTSSEGESHADDLR